jgi:betaine-aldehyde dehydrogenase
MSDASAEPPTTPPTEARLRSEAELYVDGRRTAATSGERFPTFNPATGAVLAQVHQSNDADVDAAVASAKAAFPGWAALTGAERGRILNRAAALLRERNDELARIEVADTGKPIAEASTVDVLRGPTASSTSPARPPRSPAST